MKLVSLVLPGQLLGADDSDGQDGYRCDGGRGAAVADGRAAESQ